MEERSADNAIYLLITNSWTEYFIHVKENRKFCLSADIFLNSRVAKLSLRCSKPRTSYICGLLTEYLLFPFGQLLNKTPVWTDFGRALVGMLKCLLKNMKTCFSQLVPRIERASIMWYMTITYIQCIVNKKDHWDSGKPRRQQSPFCDIQIKVVISHRLIYVYHTDLLPLKILVTLTLTFQCHSRSNVKVPLDSPYMVSY